MSRCLICLLAAFITCNATISSACPANLFLGQLPDQLKGLRANMRLYVQSATKPGHWQTIPLQVDPIDENGRLVFFGSSDYMQESLTASDLLVFRIEDFGPKLVGRSGQLQCSGGQIYELNETTTNRYAYLTNCDQAGAVHYPNTVSFDAAAKQLQSPLYKYQFNSKNHMLFQAIKFRLHNGTWEEAATDSQMLIRADVKNFFTMLFDSRHIESNLEENRSGQLGSLARVTFFLRVLFFKIRMSLATDVGFFSYSGHIPMMINIPVNASAYLRHGSGIFYSWVLSSAARSGGRGVDMPVLDPEVVKKGPRALADIGVRYCQGKDCHFRYMVDLNGQRLAMDISIRRDLVERGFFPFYVDDASAVSDSMGWDGGEGMGGSARSGMYFEVSGLPKGEHPWDFWLRLGSPVESRRTCPAPVRVKLIR